MGVVFVTADYLREDIWPIIWPMVCITLRGDFLSNPSSYLRNVKRNSERWGQQAWYGIQPTFESRTSQSLVRPLLNMKINMFIYKFLLTVREYEDFLAIRNVENCFNIYAGCLFLLIWLNVLCICVTHKSRLNAKSVELEK